MGARAGRRPRVKRALGWLEDTSPEARPAEQQVGDGPVGDPGVRGALSTGRREVRIVPQQLRRVAR